MIRLQNDFQLKYYGVSALSKVLMLTTETLWRRSKSCFSGTKSTNSLETEKPSRCRILLSKIYTKKKLRHCNWQAIIYPVCYCIPLSSTKTCLFRDRQKRLKSEIWFDGQGSLRNHVDMILLSIVRHNGANLLLD